MSRNSLSGWLLVLLMTVTTLLLMIVDNTTVQASSEPAYVIKSAKVKMYRHPGLPKSRAKYMGTTGIYHHNLVYIEHQIKRHGRTYVRVIKPLNSSNLRHSKEVKAIEAGIDGYFPKSNLRRVKPILRMIKMPKTAFHIVNSKYDFWDMIPSTDGLGETDTISRGDHYLRQTLYVTQQKITYSQQKYDLVQTKAGRTLGWLNAKALKKTAYSQPTVALTKGIDSGNVQVWHNPSKKKAAVAVVINDSQITEIIAQNQDVDSLQIKFEHGKPVSLTKILYNGKHVTVKRSRLFKFDTRKSESQVTVEADQRLGKKSAKTYQTIYSTLKINQNGKIQQIIQKKDRWLLENDSPNA